MRLPARLVIPLILITCNVVSAQPPSELGSGPPSHPQELSLRVVPVEEFDSLVGFRVLNVEALEPYLTGPFDLSDVVLLPAGPLTGQEVAADINSGRFEFLHYLVQPSSTGSIRWRVRSESGVQREAILRCFGSATVSVDFAETLRQWAERRGVAEDPSLIERLIESR